jgi:hypothetical protein
MDENRNTRQVRLRPHTATLFGPAHQGHHSVRDDEIGHELPDTFKRLGPITCTKHVISLAVRIGCHTARR